ncbi:MAG TPA: helix-hairpin-helix domain-containing protein [Thermoanaerobaculia bacterium]|nr:helix-hairpin-helix domain-containing protein [Thermoanaerobaculia bacterium]
MEKRDVADALQRVAAMLDLAGENPFKIRAYENAAQAIAEFSGDLGEALETGRLRELRGIGSGIFANIETLWKTGSLPVQEELEARFPPGLTECLGLPGLGVGKVRRLHEALGIDSLDGLEQACRGGRLAGVPGFGEKTVARILQGIAIRRSGAGLHRLPRAQAIAASLVSRLVESGRVARAEVAGSLRRRRELVADIDLVVAAADPARLLEELPSLLGGTPAGSRSERSVRIPLREGLGVDISVARTESFGASLLWDTGSRAHIDALRARAGATTMDFGAGGLFRPDTRETVAAATEEEIYAALGLPWIPPELREATGEIEAAQRGALPDLISLGALKGLIHVHSSDSDGRAPLEEMLDAAREAGYQYVALTDHSKTAAYAGGLTEERVLLQRERVRAYALRHPSFSVFHGTEADIHADGTVDFGDEFLEGFDLVVASVHSRFGLSREEQTRRLVRAVRNPRVSVLGHPSGRLLLSRPPLDADWDAVLDAAAESGCAVEVNGNPQRLDLEWSLCRKAVARGILLALDPDAHSVAELGLVSYAVDVARKGWATAASVLNAQTAGELKEWLERRRGKALR